MNLDKLKGPTLVLYRYAMCHGHATQSVVWVSTSRPSKNIDMHAPLESTALEPLDSRHIVGIAKFAEQRAREPSCAQIGRAHV